MASPPEPGEAASTVEETPWHAMAPAAVAQGLGVSLEGLDSEAAAHRLARFGPNRLEPPRPIAAWRVLLRQFQSPLIYVLFAASAIALALGERSDAAFIGAVLVLNAAIGFANELRAERQVHALFQQTRGRARLRRDGTTRDVDATEVVPGDVLLLESGERIAADVRLLDSKGLRVDESLLTGESLPVEKRADDLLEPTTTMADRRNMAFSSTLVASGRGVGLVVATGARTQIGAIARDVAAVDTEKPPLVVRMERFARAIGVLTLGICGLLVGIGLLQGEPWGEVLLGAVALAVSAIPEGLPVALTVALAVAVSRMAHRNVIARHLTAVEALGSCGVIATDKTGTLTQNELTVECAIVGGVRYDATGRGYVPARRGRAGRAQRRGCRTSRLVSTGARRGAGERGESGRTRGREGELGLERRPDRCGAAGVRDQVGLPAVEPDAGPPAPGRDPLRAGASLRRQLRGARGRRARLRQRRSRAGAADVRLGDRRPKRRAHPTRRRRRAREHRGAHAGRLSRTCHRRGRDAVACRARRGARRALRRSRSSEWSA